MYITDIDELVAALREKLQDYLVLECGEDAANPRRKFRCFAHEDQSPSMSYNPKDGYTTVKCWSGCGHFDIFSACNHLEGLPTSGPEWVTQTLPHLAEKLKVPIKLGEPTVADKRKAKLLKLVHDMCTLLEASEPPIEYLEERGWSREHLTIGSIDPDTMISKLIEMGWSSEYLISSLMIRTRDKEFFGEDKITFAIKDYRARPIAFVSRNLVIQPKYINTLESPIYDKSKTLLGLDVALKQAKRDGLIVVEGPGDLAALHKAGVTNAVAICGTAFTADHLATLKMLGVRTVFFCLDWDKAGFLATHRIFKNELKFAPGVSCYVVEQPDGLEAEDVSTLLQMENGREIYDSLTRTPAFEWVLRFVSDNDSPEDVCTDIVPIIASEASAIRRELLIKTLAEVTQVSFQSIAQDVSIIRDSKEAERMERVDGAIQKYARAAAGDPENILAHISQHEEDLRKIDKDYKRHVIGINYQLARYEAVLQQKNSVGQDENMAEFLYVHHSMFKDALAGGMNSTSGVHVIVGGRANSGKTATVISLGTDVALHDPFAVVVAHFTDDSYTQVEPRFVANIAAMQRQAHEPKLTIGMAANPHYNINTDAEWDVYNRAVNTLRTLLQEERLVIIDSEDGTTLTALERNLRYVRQRHPQKKLLVVADNTHNYTDFPEFDQTSRMRKIASTQKTLTGKYHCCMIATAEYRKNMPGDESKMKLPVNDDLADARALIYRPNIIIHVYNDLHDRGENAEIFWLDQEDPSLRKPRLMLVFAKNKISSFKSPEQKLMLDLDPDTVTLTQRDLEGARDDTREFMQQLAAGDVQVLGERVVFNEADWE